MSNFVSARNANLEKYLNDFIIRTRPRWTYLRDARRRKIGLLLNFVNTDQNGRQEMYVGWSKAVVSKGDRFALDMGLVKAIERAVPFGIFMKMYENQQLPNVPMGWRVARDEDGYVVENEYEFYDQYEEFVRKLKVAYKNLVSEKVLA